MARNNVYTFLEGGLIVPGANWSGNWNIQRPSRELKIKSIWVDLFLRNQTTGNIIQFENNKEVNFQLRIGSLTENIAQPFNIPAGVVFVRTGGHFYFTKPQQIIFDSFYIANQLDFDCVITNMSAANNYLQQMSLIVETQEKILY